MSRRSSGSAKGVGTSGAAAAIRARSAVPVKSHPGVHFGLVHRNRGAAVLCLQDAPCGASDAMSGRPACCSNTGMTTRSSQPRALDADQQPVSGDSVLYCVLMSNNWVSPGADRVIHPGDQDPPLTARSSRRVASAGSGALRIAEMTATPSAPAVITAAALSMVMPPIPTAGTRQRATWRASPSSPRGGPASAFDPVA
jgi:hypothetical protein